MRNNKHGLLIIFIFVISTVLISACEKSLSSAPVATPTSIPTGLFVEPLPSAENPMAMIEEFAKQTAAAQTTVANGGTPVTLQAITTGTVITPQAGATATPTLAPSTPTNAVATTPVVATPGGPTTTPVPAGVRPASYTLQSGEFPYCIARRFNVDPDALLSLSGLTSAEANSLVSGTVLKIPQSGAFPGNRALAPHPTTYTVSSSDETVYGVACKFGDVDPSAIASANGISVSAKLTAGQQIKIP
jgi:LysM repeat protein